MQLKEIHLSITQNSTSMKLKIICILLAISSILSAQSYQINGSVEDIENTPLIGATVVILDQDTTMIAFGITDELGHYEIYDVPAGDQIIQISYTGYTDHSKAISLDGEQDKIHIELIALDVSSKVLEEVSIKAEHIPMGILGDTINYNTAAFKTRQGASVEDLLKKLPGIDVARDGSIKAQGKDVRNVLVDGKEFFSGDATSATKNLEAAAVDKVQVFDKKSEEAEFTGVDDGQEEKTINLKLKEGFKNGGFGKVVAEGGTEDTRYGKLNYNRFNPSMQLSVIANSNNINEQAFSFNEYVDFLGGFQNVMAIGGLSDYQNGVNGASSGIKTQSSIGTNLNLDIFKKVKLNTNYLFAKNRLNLDEISRSDNFTNVVNFTTLDTSFRITNGLNHRLNTKLKFNPNPINAFTLSTRLFLSNTNDQTDSQSQYLVDNQHINSLTSNLLINNNSLSFSSELLYKRNFVKKGRNMLSRLKYEKVSRDEQSDFDNLLTYSSIDDRTIQYQSFRNKKNVWSGSINYNEPIGKKLYLVFNYRLVDESETPIRRYFNREKNQLKELGELSGAFHKQWNSHTGGITLKRNRKKIKLNAGLEYTITNLIASQYLDILNDKSSFKYLLPSLGINKTLKGSATLSFDYKSNVQAPSISQMVNQVNNQNPNITILGTPNLTPEYTHTITIAYNKFDSFNFSSLFWNATAISSPNKIVNSRDYTENLITEILPINANNFLSLSTYINHSTPIRKLKMKYSLTGRISYSKYNTLINKISNNISNANAQIGITLENRNKDIFDITGGMNLSLDAFSNNFNSNFGTPFLNQSVYLDVFAILGNGWEIGSKYDFLTYNSSFFDEGQVLHLINASLSKSFFENKLSVKLTAHDILNQNKGVSRSGGANSLNDNRFNTLGQYVMLGVSYRIGMQKKNSIEIN